MKNAKELHARRTARIRRKLKSRGGGRPRLSVFRSARHIYAQVIDDGRGHTVASVSSLEPTVRSAETEAGKIATAALVGRMIAERATAAGVSEVILDRGGYRYHGRVKALADGAREGGLVF